jgi:hypothetical protein
LKLLLFILIPFIALGGSHAKEKSFLQHLEEVSPTEVVEETAAEEVVTISKWVLPGASSNEKVVLDALQERGIADRAALATIMGNIKQESRFHSNICEGGARIGFWSCTSGGYGLIQWTTIDRYNGLARHSRLIGRDPSSTEAQISYLFTERQWRSIEPSLKTPGQSINFYMSKAYYWLGWGHHGRRTTYAFNYADRLSIIEIPVTK